MKRQLLWSILALSALVSPLTAQRAERFDELGGYLRLGDRVVVQTTNHESVRGPVSALTRDAISVKTGSLPRTLSSAEILQVVRRRGHGRKGVLVGVGAVWAVGLASPCREDCELIPVLLTPVAALIGGGIGVLLSSNQVVYERAGASSTPSDLAEPHMATALEAPAARRATLRPTLHRGAIGASVSIAW